jgi:hypothetical protein
MARTEGYVPKVNDVVLMKGQGFVRYVVTKVDNEAKRADVKTTFHTIVLHRDIPWPELYEPDEGQNAGTSQA